MASRRKLNEKLRRLVVTRFAQFATPSEIQEEIRENHGVEVSRPALLHYDPECASTDTPKKWVALHAEERRRFLDTESTAAIAHIQVRIVRYEKLFRRAIVAGRNGNIPLALQIMEQAAKEMGGLYTNKRRHDVFPLPHPDDLTDEEADRIIDGEDPWKVIAETRGDGVMVDVAERRGPERSTDALR